MKSFIVHHKFSKDGSIGQYHVQAETEHEARAKAKEQFKNYAYYKVVKVEARY